jgi:hypothetical protein
MITKVSPDIIMEQISLTNAHNNEWALFLPAVSSFFI